MGDAADRANCDGVGNDVTASSYFHRDGEDPVLFYSYATCSGENTFTDSTDDDQACNEDHSEVTASHCGLGGLLVPDGIFGVVQVPPPSRFSRRFSRRRRRFRRRFSRRHFGRRRFSRPATAARHRRRAKAATAAASDVAS